MKAWRLVVRLAAGLALALAGMGVAAFGDEGGANAAGAPQAGGNVAEAPARLGLSVEESDRMLRSGRAALEDGLLELAEEKLGAVRERSVDRRRRSEAMIWLARCWLAEGGMDKAWTALEAVSGEEVAGLKDAELRVEAERVRAEALARLGRVDEALAAVESMGGGKDASGADARALAWGVQLAAESGKLDAAVKLHGALTNGAAVVAGEPELALAKALEAAGRQEEAERLYARLEGLPKDNPWREKAEWARLERALAAGTSNAVPEAEAWAAAAGRSAELARQAWRRIAQSEAANTNAAAMANAQAAAEKALALAESASQRLQDRLLLAQLDLQAGNVATATEAMRQLATEIPDAALAAAVQKELVGALMKAEDWQRAADEVQHWLDAFEGGPETRNVRLAQAVALEHLGHAAEAAEVWQRAVEDIDPMADGGPSWNVLLRAADALYAAGRMADAKAAYEKLLALPGVAETAAPGIQLRLAEISLRTAPDAPDGELLLQELSKDVKAGAAAWDAAMRLGRLYEERGADELAAAQYSRIVDAPPSMEGTPAQDAGAGSPNAVVAPTGPMATLPPPSPERRAEALLARGLVRHRLGDEAAALDDFGRILAETPASGAAAQAQYMQAWCLHAMGREKEAAVAANALLTNPAALDWVPRTRFLLAEQAFNRGDYATATNEFAKIAADAPDSPLAPDALYWAGRSAAAMRAYLEADRHFNALIAAYPDHPRLADALLAQGDVLSELGNFSAAIAAFSEVANSYPRTPQAIAAWGRKGDAQFTLGQQEPARYEEALLSYRTLREYASVPPDLRLQADYKIGRCLEKTGHAQAAVAQYMAVAYDYLQQTAPAPESAVWFTRAAFAAAALQEATGNWREAIGIYRRVASSGVAAGPEALDRIRRIQDDHWYQLLPADENAADASAPSAPAAADSASAAPEEVAP